MALTDYSEGIVFAHFSQTYVALGLYVMMLAICLKRDLSIFIKVASYGSVAIAVIALVIISLGIYSFSNTNFTAVLFPT